MSYRGNLVLLFKPEDNTRWVQEWTTVTTIAKRHENNLLVFEIPNDISFLDIANEFSQYLKTKYPEHDYQRLDSKKFAK